MIQTVVTVIRDPFFLRPLQDGRFEKVTKFAFFERDYQIAHLPNFAQKLSLHLEWKKVDLFLLARLDWSTQNSSCTLNLPMFSKEVIVHGFIPSLKAK